MSSEPGVACWQVRIAPPGARKARPDTPCQPPSLNRAAASSTMALSGSPHRTESRSGQEASSSCAARLGSGPARARWLRMPALRKVAIIPKVSERRSAKRIEKTISRGRVRCASSTRGIVFSWQVRVVSPSGPTSTRSAGRPAWRRIATMRRAGRRCWLRSSATSTGPCHGTEAGRPPCRGYRLTRRRRVHPCRPPAPARRQPARPAPSPPRPAAGSVPARPAAAR